MSSELSPASIASCALSTFSSLPPKAHPSPTEWCTLAAFVAHSSTTNTYHTISLATGSKCTPPAHLTAATKPYALHDSHAEVLARRTFRQVLLLELQDASTGASTAASTSTPTSTFRLLHNMSLAPSITIHLFVSESPCGASSIYALDDNTTNFTGAKVTASSASSSIATSNTTLPPPPTSERSKALTIVRETNTPQSESALRLKSGRSNLPPTHRSTCHSCSDKILRWTSLGLTGSLLSSLIEPVHLSSVTVMRDPRNKSTTPQLTALKQAVHRHQSTIPVHVLPATFPHSRMAKAITSPSPSGQSANFCLSDTTAGKGGSHFVELTVGATGLPQQKGKKRKKGGEDEPVVPVVHSRLSRASTLAMVRKLIGGGEAGTYQAGTYQAAKGELTSDEHKAKKDAFLEMCWETKWVSDKWVYDFQVQPV